MCGRFVRHSNVRVFTDLVGAMTAPADDRPRYNIAPSQTALVARENPDSGQRELAALKWGLVPHWSREASTGYKLINARSETAATRSSFRDCVRYRRCLIAADGWYEWRQAGDGKIPMFIQQVTEGGEIVPVYFAGLWSIWRDRTAADGDRLETFTILTREAAPELREIHARMPVVLPATAYDAWLDRSVTDAATAVDVLAASVLTGFHAYPVSRRVNKPAEDDATLMAPAS